MSDAMIVKGASKPQDPALIVQNPTKIAFDRHAETYRIRWEQNRVAQAQRRTVHRAVDRLLPRPARVLDLGCGTGVDLAHLSRRGHAVVGVDLSPQMVDKAKERCPQATVLVRDLERPETLPDGPFDLVLTNFGALNCVSGLRELGRAVRTRLSPGGHVVAVVMSRFCVAEALWLLCSGHPRAALGRRRSLTVAVEGIEVPVRYLSPADLEAFGEPVSIQGLGVVLPPPDGPFRRMDWLERADRRVGRWPLLRHVGDHTLVVLRAAGAP